MRESNGQGQSHATDTIDREGSADCWKAEASERRAGLLSDMCLPRTPFHLVHVLYFSRPQCSDVVFCQHHTCMYQWWCAPFSMYVL